MNLFSIIFHAFIITSQSMITDMRSAFANMLHHTLFEKQGPPQGKSTSIIEGFKLDYGS